MSRKTTIIVPLVFLLIVAIPPDMRVGAESEFPLDLFTLDLAAAEERDEDPWCVGIYASYYGSVKGRKYYACIDNLIHPREEFFVALPSKRDSLECLDGRMMARVDDNTAVFRVIEIKPHGVEGPVLEATVEDLGPWYCGNDSYWEKGTRPASEDGRDDKGRRTNGAGIDLSYRLAQELVIDGIGKVDWRFKRVDGEYVVREKTTKFRR